MHPATRPHTAFDASTSRARPPMRSRCIKQYRHQNARARRVRVRASRRTPAGSKHARASAVQTWLSITLRTCVAAIDTAVAACFALSSIFRRAICAACGLPSMLAWYASRQLAAVPRSRCRRRVAATGHAQHSHTRTIQSCSKTLRHTPRQCRVGRQSRRRGPPYSALRERAGSRCSNPAACRGSTLRRLRSDY